MLLSKLAAARAGAKTAVLSDLEGVLKLKAKQRADRRLFQVKNMFDKQGELKGAMAI